MTRELRFGVYSYLARRPLSGVLYAWRCRICHKQETGIKTRNIAHLSHSSHVVVKHPEVDTPEPEYTTEGSRG